MEPSIFKYIFKYSGKQQVLLVVFTIISFPFLYYSLELPKLIVNKAIGSQDFPKQILAFELNQVQYLLVLCAIFLFLVAINGIFKYYINVFKGVVGERMLRRLRFTLFDRTLRFPVGQFRRTSQGEVIAMITSEVEPLGGFIGDAVALPVFQGGTLLTILFFMFVQDPVLGLAAIALYPVQMYVIPKLQKQVNNLAKQRVRTVRRLSERIGDAISGIEEIHAHDTSEFHRAEFARWVGTIYDIRFAIYRKKFFIKFINNFLAQVTPFFFFSIGGYLVIIGDLTFGALVAVLAAYKDLSSPWKELLTWYQMKEDSRIKYEQLVEQFHPPEMLDEDLQKKPDGPVPTLAGKVVATNLMLQDDGGVKLLDGAGFAFDLDNKVAFVGGSGSGADSAASVVARLTRPTSGSVLIGDANLSRLPEAVTGQRIGFIGPNGHLFNGSVRDNVLYGLRHQPRHQAVAGDAARQRYINEAERSGNTISDIDDDWTDYEAAAASDADDLVERVISIMQTVDMEPELFAFGLNGTVEVTARPDLAASVLSARGMLHARLRDSRYTDLVEPFDRERYNQNMSVAENLLFGMPVGPVFDIDHIGDDPYVRSVLDEVGLLDEFAAVGLQVAKIMVDLFHDLPTGHPFYERFSFIGADVLPEYQAVIRRIDAVGIGRADENDRRLLLSLPFKLITARHRLGIYDDAFGARLVEARRIFAEKLPADRKDSIAFFDADAFNPAASVQDNILFGKLVYGRPQSQREVGILIGEVIEELGLRRAIVELGLDFEVGIGGQRLSSSQRQKIALARTLIKNPQLLILNQALGTFDAASQAAITERLRTAFADKGQIWVMADASDIEAFDHIFHFEAGRVVVDGDDTRLPEVVQRPPTASD